MPLHRRSLELRLHLLREGTHLLCLHCESARPVGRHPGEAQQDYPRPARSRGPPADQGARQEAGGDPGRDGGDHPGGPRALHARTDRRVGLLPVHLDAGHLQFRVRRSARAPGFPGLFRSRVAAPRRGAARGRVEPDRKEDSLVRFDLRGGQGPARHQRGEADGHAAAHSAAARRVARREPGDRRRGPGRVRDREGVIRPDHGGLCAPRRAHGVSGGRPDHPRAGGRAPPSGHRVLQDGGAGRGGARVPPRGRAALGGGERPLLYRARGAQAGALARGDGGVASGRGEGRRPTGGVPQPRLRLRAAGAARRGGGRLRRGGGARADRREGVSGLGRRGAEARRLRRRRRAARPRAGVVREGAAARLVLGPFARRRGRGGIRAGARSGGGGGGGLPLPRGAAEQSRGAEGALGRSDGRRVCRAGLPERRAGRGVHTSGTSARLLDQDAHEYDLLLDALTINVTKFFRNLETWHALEPWLDGLWQARRGDVRVWSAGCASGEEPYTVAVALAEAARPPGQAPPFPRARVDATDIDRTSLERTEAAEYAEPAFTEMPPELVRRYFTAQSPRHPLPELRRIVRVLKHDLTTEPRPAPPFDLVVCRNVGIYFVRPMHTRLCSLFAADLATRGVPLNGKVETLFGPARERLV